MTDLTADEQLTAAIDKAMENFTPADLDPVVVDPDAEKKEAANDNDAGGADGDKEARDTPEGGDKDADGADGAAEGDKKAGDSLEGGDKDAGAAGAAGADDAGAGDGDADEEELLTVSASWSKEDRDIFDKMEPDAQQILLQQSKNLQKGFTRKSIKRADDLKAYGDIVSLYSGMEVLLNQNGLNPVTATQRLVGVQQLLMQNPEAGLRQLMTDYNGGDLKGIVTRMAQDIGVLPAANDSQADEYVSDTEKALQQRVTAMEQSQARQVQQTQTQQTNDVQNQVNMFEHAVDGDGNKLHPHFQDVRVVMSALMTSGASPDMDHAYKSAIRSNDNHFDSLVSDGIVAAQKKADAKRQEKVAKSKDAGANVSSNKVPSKGRQNRLSTDDAILKAMSKHKFG